MCGICGFIIVNKIDAEFIIKQMNKSIFHRGPDDEGFYIDNNIALGVRRLSIIDLEGGHQPIANEDESILVSYNGEIYNFLEIREELIKKGHKFKTRCDTEVIVHSYEEYGEECVNKFNGMFAFALWDKKEKKLFLARDRLGVKPIYYAVFNNNFIFASELKAILQHPSSKKEIDVLGLSEFLTYDFISAPRTIFKNIFKLYPGYILIWKNNKYKIKKYWDIEFTQSIKYKEKEIIEEILSLLSHSVKLRLISDVPLGLFLSGGVDSSSVLYFMTKHSNKKVKTFNIGFEEKSFDESSYAKLVSRYFDCEHYEMIVTNKMVLDILPKLKDFIDEPCADPSFIPTFFVSKYARENVKVVLSGEGGDELFAGYENYQGIKAAKIYRKFIPNFLNNNLIKPVVERLPVSFSYITFDYKAKKFVNTNNVPLQYANFLWKGGFNEKEKLKIFTDNYLDEIKRYNVYETIDKYYNPLNNYNDDLNKILYLDLKLYLADDLLTKIDRMSMANSLEARTPFLDYRFVELAFKISSNLKLKRFITKYIFKETMKNKIPVNIINRRKKGFGIPVSFWVRDEKFKRFVQDILSVENIKKQGYFKYQEVRKILDEHFNMKKDNRKLIWSLLIFGIWYEKYIRN